MIRREIDWRPPLDAFAPLADAPYACLLQAGVAACDPGNAVIAAFPSSVLEAREETAFLDGRRLDMPPFAALKRLAGARRRAAATDAPPFATGLLGFLGYEMGGELEPTAVGPASPFALPDMAFGAYDAAAVFDVAANRAAIHARTEESADRLAEALGAAPVRLAPAPAGLAVSSNFDAPAYQHAVALVMALIRDGALFQANLAQQFSVAAPDAYSVFARLMQGDAAFGAYLCYAEGAIVSNSPERFFSLRRDGAGLRILAEPIKGTRPRGATPQEDARLAAELLSDRKERAENVMIADLTRNDLSRICEDGSIREEAICALSTQTSVHHLVSRISGALKRGFDAADALAALFPCGSITGAPKVEAMRVIAQMEKIGRGPYCGAIGYIDDGGTADFSVAIRTLIVESGRATFPVGGGVTLRSDPQAEYEETLVKARAMIEALGVQRGAAA